VAYKSVPLMCDSSSATCLAQSLVFHGRAKHIKVRHHFLRDHVEKGDIEMRCIDIERQLADIFTKPLDATHFASLQGGVDLVFAITMGWFEGELVFYLVYTLFYLHRIAFHSYQSNLLIASPIILACIWLTALIIVLGRVEMRCETLLC
jgi:hypothetical protein